MPKKVAAVIVAAGRGARIGGEVPKQYREIAGRAVILWSLEALAAAGVSSVAAVIQPEDADRFAAASGAHPGIRSVSGGATRAASVQAGLDALAADAPDIVLIHDAARPGLTPSVVTALIEAIAGGADGAAPVLPMADSLRRVSPDQRVLGEADRDGLVRVQTPQAFRYDALRAAFAKLPPDAAPTDDLAVAHAAGLDVRVIPGDPLLTKLTYPEDFAMLERLLGAARTTVTGFGVDAHRFGPGEFVTLCGVRIPHDKGLIGHSDADAGWHALVDAILGALGEGDIGAHFPPSDPQWKGADSEKFLRHAAALVQQHGARIAHVDITLLCEKPKIGPHREAMRARTAEVLGLPLTRVSVKATTTEHMGFLGREEGLAAQAVASVERAL